jgi:hypothetical protein
MTARRLDRTTNIERETPLFSYQLVLAVHKERQRELECRIRLRSLGRDRIRRISFRQRLGRGLIQFGSMLAGDGPLQLAARR